MCACVCVRVHAGASRQAGWQAHEAAHEWGSLALETSGKEVGSGGKTLIDVVQKEAKDGDVVKLTF